MEVGQEQCVVNVQKYPAAEAEAWEHAMHRTLFPTPVVMRAGCAVRAAKVAYDY